MNKEELKKWLLEQFKYWDPDYMYSDDPTVYAENHRKAKMIWPAIRKLGDEGQKLFDEYYRRKQ